MFWVFPVEKGVGYFVVLVVLKEVFDDVGFVSSIYSFLFFRL